MFLKIFIFLGCFTVPFLLKSQNNSLVVFSNSGQTFTLEVNNIQINKIEQTNVKASNLNKGWNKLKLTSNQDNKTVTINDSFLISEKYINKEFTFAVISKENKLSFKSISEPSGPETPPVPEKPKEIAPVIDNNLYGKLYKAENNKPLFFDNYSAEKNNCEYQLTNTDIQNALNLLNKCNDDERKLVYLNSIIEKNCYSTVQLIKLISVLPIEMDKLNASKLAYNHITDKENINLLQTSFKFETMKQSFLSFKKDQEVLEKQKKLDCKTAVTEVQFSEILKSIKQNSYENGKTIATKIQLSNNCISSAQAKKILDLFTHDREKLEVLKFTYNVLVDKENAKTLADELQFEESKTEFLKYIK